MRQPAAGALLALALAGCGGEREAAASIPRERFVAANVAMRSVSDSAPNAQALRAQALERHKVSEKDLKQFVHAHGRDPEYMAKVWRDISNKVDSAWERTQPRDAPPSDVPPPPDDAVPGERPPGLAERLGRSSTGPAKAPPPLGRSRSTGAPIIIREPPTPTPASVDTPRRPVPLRRRPPEGPPADTRPWVPNDSVKLRIPPPPQP